MVLSSQSSRGINVPSVIGGVDRSSLSAKRQCRRSERQHARAKRSVAVLLHGDLYVVAPQFPCPDAAS
jgi:hypothetical protein